MFTRKNKWINLLWLNRRGLLLAETLRCTFMCGGDWLLPVVSEGAFNVRSDKLELDWESQLSFWKEIEDIQIETN